MASLTESFVEKNQAFVIKLKLVGLGAAPQIRRIRLKSIASIHGSVSYDDLVGLAIQFTFPNTPAEQFDEFDVTLTYYDVDNDCITLATTEELMDAIEQYADGGCGTLRLTTDVRKKKSKHRSSKERRESTSRASSSVSSSSDSVPPETTGPSLYPAATPSNPSSHQRVNGPQVLEALLESFVSILAAAVVALQNHLTPSPGAGAAATSPPIIEALPSEPLTISESEPVNEVIESVTESPVAEAPQEPEKEIVVERVDCLMPPPRQSPPPIPTASSVTVTSSTSASASTTTCTARASVSTTPSTATTVLAPASVTASVDTTVSPSESCTKTEPEERLFIHGRHTCDGCLCTPIVGKRFHALNLKDYDLCEACMVNYKGTEIQFEPVELDRDRAFQERWHRRRQKWSQCRPNDGHRHRPPHHFGPHGPPPHPHGPPHGHPRPFGPPHGPPYPHGPLHSFGLGMPPMPPHHFGPPPSFQPNANGAENFEDALKEAIQRSLKDMMEKVASKPDEHKIEDPIPELVKDTPSPVVVPESVKKTPASAVVPPIVVPAPELVRKAPAPAVVAPVLVPAPELVNEVPASAVVAPDTPLLVELVKETPLPATVAVKPLSEPESMEIDDDTDEDVSTMDRALVVAVKEGSTEVLTEEESFSEEEIMIDPEDEEDDDDNEEVIKVEAVQSGENTDDGSFVEKRDLEEEPSFSSDAAGNGDVAVALGHTLDQCAREIDAMVSELMRSDTRDINQDDDSDFPSNQGATILESVEDENKQHLKDDERSDDGWQVVTESQQISDDEALARAAQFVGSALFNSDITGRSAVMSTLSGSGGSLSTHLSSIPTLPSVVPSIAPLAPDDSSMIPLAQLNRWAVQLKQLHELGFHDEKTNVAILERIAAANIGADLFEEISVTQVVNDLLNGKFA